MIGQNIAGLQRRIHEQLNGPIPAPRTWFGRTWHRLTCLDRPETSDAMVLGLSLFWTVALWLMAVFIFGQASELLRSATGWPLAWPMPDKITSLAVAYAVMVINVVDLIIVMATQPADLAGQQSADSVAPYLEARPMGRSLYLLVRFAFAVALWNAALFAQSLVLGEVAWSDYSWTTKYLYMPLLLTFPFSHYSDRIGGALFGVREEKRTGRRPVAKQVQV